MNTFEFIEIDNNLSNNFFLAKKFTRKKTLNWLLCLQKKKKKSHETFDGQQNIFEENFVAFISLHMWETICDAKFSTTAGKMLSRIPVYSMHWHQQMSLGDGVG